LRFGIDSAALRFTHKVAPNIKGGAISNDGRRLASP
jgi:hypothetical protein